MTEELKAALTEVFDYLRHQESRVLRDRQMLEALGEDPEPNPLENDIAAWLQVIGRAIGRVEQSNPPLRRHDRRKQSMDNYFGACPICGKQDGYVNVGRDHWFVCDQHRVKWYVGSNLFSSWREQDERDREKCAALLMKYLEVEPR